MLQSSVNTTHLIDRLSSLAVHPPSPPIMSISNVGLPQNLSFDNNISPRVIHMPNNQEVTYKQNVIVRWLKPPTPPPPAPIIIREIQCPPEIPPPIIYRQVPQCPRTPPPIIVREQPQRCLPRQAIVQRCRAPASQPQTVVCNNSISSPIRQHNVCQPNVCRVMPQNAPCRRLVREIIRQVPQQCVRPAQVCTTQLKQQIIQPPPEVVQQVVPVFATRQHIVQPRGIRVIRQVVGPA
ncbi:unnamed protein product [Rotaria magnacalcarata]|uniref:Uncharacterized protein n=2 Tax=Rotaria magnacalcarata TaxID=392030 RepID=A0A815ZJ54_9BILA|nr:unnamed protein product [Rotaria magnacalcarata]CAF1629682.1 unnamed protein product [Rotaria magnacalcarata]CAF2005643.1 unnamed protein product [Rotaria magnacalcarata]CAF2049434.1 unnamed protein product [Rotaria magnacalcarata]CAF2061805.1 unnamed protein product [Rotaria magnacalcarata]